MAYTNYKRENGAVEARIRQILSQMNDIVTEA